MALQHWVGWRGWGARKPPAVERHTRGRGKGDVDDDEDDEGSDVERRWRVTS